MPTPGTETQVGATPVLIVQATSHAQSVIIRNAGSSNSAFLGDSTVTSPSGANPGYELVPGANTPTIQLNPEEAIYAICGTGLSTRVDTLASYSA